MTERLAWYEWLAVLALLASGVVIVRARVSSPPPLPSPPEALPTLMRVEIAEDGRAIARLDDDTLATACRAIGLPDPPRLDGADPVPVRLLLEEMEAWAATRATPPLGRVGRIYQAIEMHGPALACFAALTRLEPDEAVWQYFMGTEAQALGRDDLAIEALEASRRRDPGDATACARLGQLYLERGDLDTAGARYEQCRALQPGRSLGHTGLGRVAARRGDHAAAIEHLRRAVAATPNDFLAYRHLSQTLAAAGDADGARRASERAERLPHYEGWLVFDEKLQASHALARTQRYLENQMRLAAGAGDATRLAELATRLLERRPRDHNTMALLATALIQLDRTEEALETVTGALALKPDGLRLLYTRAQIAAIQRDFDTVHRVLDRTEAIDPRFAPVHELRGRVLFLENRPEAGIAAIETAVTLEPDVIPRRLLLAVMQERSGDRDAAIRTLEATLAIAPDDERARAMLQQLER
ncbi:MAG: tetratricopeptide repeat protein [Phycisphaerales bacterium]|nr:tetratricopeptide repeat protein [Phycisphaerales bacterium]